MEVLVASHPAALRHQTTPNHPERAERVEAVLTGLRGSGLDVTEITSPLIERSELALVHDPSYIEMVENFCGLGGGALDMDTFASKDSWEAALAAAGGVRVLVSELEDAGAACGFAVSRPPGHHALRDRAMGFCLFNNVGVSAAYLRSRGERVAILDWDVHHGNGTQASFLDDPGMLYVSLHQDHFYPYEGSLDDISAGEAKGTTVNVPLPEGTAGDVYRRAWEELVIPVVSQFEPTWLLVSAGYDAHADDFLAGMQLMASDFAWMAARLGAIHPPNRIVFALEGGYDLAALEASAAATVGGLAGVADDSEGSLESPREAWHALDSARSAISRYWVV